MTKAMQVTNTFLDSTRVPPSLRPGPPPEPTPAGEFRVINSAWVHPLTGKSGVLADMADGRRLARHVEPGQWGKPVYAYWLIDHDPGKAPVALGSLHDEVDRLCTALDASRSHPRNGTGLLLKTPLEAEIARFRAAWPEISNHLGFNEVKVERLFDVGEVYRTMTYDRAMAGDVEFGTYLNLHGSGDFGAFGKLADVGPLTEEQAFCVGLQNQAVRNAEAVRSGLGVVKSAYPLTGPSGRESTVLAETALMRDSRRTFTWIRIDTQHRPN